MLIYSYSLYGVDGEEPLYIYKVGMLANLVQVARTWKRSKIHVYADAAAFRWLNRQIGRQTNLTLYDMEGSAIHPRLWRYLACDNHDSNVCVRDADSRITEREVRAVGEWLNSRYDYHIMRDSPHHRWPIMAGMFGCKMGAWPRLDFLQNQESGPYADQYWLERNLYPHIVRRALVHSNLVTYPTEHVRPFVPLINAEHIGAKVLP